MAAQVGGAFWTSFVVGVAAAMLTGFAYAELITKYPHAAGAAIYTGRAAEGDRALELPARHLADLRGVVDQLIGGDQREVPGHELDDRPHAHHGGTDADPGEAALGDRRVDDPLLAE